MFYSILVVVLKDVRVENFLLDSRRELHCIDKRYMRFLGTLSEKQWTRGIKVKGILINLGIQWIIGVLKSDKEGIREKAIDGLQKSRMKSY